jgi:hypothetical protein
MTCSVLVELPCLASDDSWLASDERALEFSVVLTFLFVQLDALRAADASEL